MSNLPSLGALQEYLKLCVQIGWITEYEGELLWSVGRDLADGKTHDDPLVVRELYTLVMKLLQVKD